MGKNSVSTNGGMGVTGALGVLFVALKLLGYIDWSWVWVLSPFWIPLAIFLAIVIFYVGHKLVTN